MTYKFVQEYPCIISALSFGILAGTFLIPLKKKNKWIDTLMQMLNVALQYQGF